MADTESYVEKVEQEHFLRRRGGAIVDKAVHIFRHDKSAAWQSQRLAQLTATFDFAMEVLGYNVKVVEINKKLTLIEDTAGKLSGIIKAGQATIDAKFHNDYVKVAVAEQQLENRERTGSSGQKNITIT